MGLGSIGIPGLILILVVALLLFGPNKLPELGRAFGKTLKEFKKGTRDIIADDDETTVRENPADAAKGDRKENDKRLPE